MFKHILLPLDGSLLAESAIPYTVELCKKLDSKVTLIHIIEQDAPQEIHGEHHLTNEKEAIEYLRKIAKNEFSFSKKVICHVHTEKVNRLSDSIVDHSDELTPDLIVLSAHGEGGLRDFMVGSIPQQVIAVGKVPVLLIQPKKGVETHFTEYSSFLVALDGEPDHEQSLAFAGNLAKDLDSKINLIRVVPTYSTLRGKDAAVSTMLPSTTNVYLEISEDEACNYLQKKLEYWRAKGVKCDAEVQRGDVAQEVVKSALSSNTSVIVLGTHGKSGLGAFWAGSVAPKIVAKTQIPILLLPVRRE